MCISWTSYWTMIYKKRWLLRKIKLCKMIIISMLNLCNIVNVILITTKIILFHKLYKILLNSFFWLNNLVNLSILK